MTIDTIASFLTDMVLFLFMAGTSVRLLAMVPEERLHRVNRARLRSQEELSRQTYRRRAQAASKGNAHAHGTLEFDANVTLQKAA